MTEPTASWNEQWREALGPLWRWQLALIALLLFAAGFSLPFADPDLSIHLATGEWVAKHHAVPFVEPFAWTRPGAPFQAYSWAIELFYFELMKHFGPMGLNVLQGITYVALAAVVPVVFEDVDIKDAINLLSGIERADVADDDPGRHGRRMGRERRH